MLLVFIVLSHLILFSSKAVILIVNFFSDWPVKRLNPLVWGSISAAKSSSLSFPLRALYLFLDCLIRCYNNLILTVKRWNRSLGEKLVYLGMANFFSKLWIVFSRGTSCVWTGLHFTFRHLKRALFRIFYHVTWNPTLGIYFTFICIRILNGNK